jgi:hypothetical protein
MSRFKKILSRVKGFRPPLVKLEQELAGYVRGLAATIEENQAQMIRHELEQYRLREVILADKDRQSRYQDEILRLRTEAA